jgi:hypothetical protein
MVSQLETCDWIDYAAWFPGVDPKEADKKIGEAVEQIKGEECAWAYTGRSFSKNAALANHEERRSTKLKFII